MHIFENRLSYKNEFGPVISMGKQENLLITPPLEFGGTADNPNPEELFVGAVNSCFFLSFQFFAKKNHLEVTSYFSTAEGFLIKDSGGFVFDKIVLSVVLQVNPEDEDKIHPLLEQAEKFCPVSRSICCPVEIKCQINPV